VTTQDHTVDGAEIPPRSRTLPRAVDGTPRLWRSEAMARQDGAEQGSPFAGLQGNRRHAVAQRRPEPVRDCQSHGWSMRHASNVIEHYALVSPSETDAVLLKLARARGDGVWTEL